MEEKYECPNCGNTDKKYLGVKNGKYYCRRCLSFSFEQVRQDYVISKDKVKLTLDYPLSEKQKNISNKVLKLLKQKKNVLICAVTGAGKTELIYESFEYYLKQGLRVGFATPRKDVVIDLLPRIQSAFPTLKVVGMYQDHTKDSVGDIIVLTTHQLHKYRNYFDLLVLDEIDAFPYAGDFVLNSLFYKALKGNYVMLSATASQEDINKIKEDNGEVLYLNERYHKHDLVVPKFYEKSKLMRVVTIINKLRQYERENKPCFIFCSTIETCIKLYDALKNIFKKIECVYSSKKDRDRIISDFKKGTILFLVTTSILERGVTIKNLQVIVYDADSDLYDSRSLIQISGRVGRKIDSYDGEVLFFCDSSNSSIDDCIKNINDVNKNKNL